MSRKHELNDYTVQAGKNIQLGQGGYYAVDSTMSVVSAANVATMKETDHIIAITALSNLSITTTAAGAHDEEDVITAFPIPNGTTFYGKWKNVVALRTDTGEGNAKAILYFG